MKKLMLPLLILLTSLMLTSCEVIGDIFGAGVYTGVFLVLLVIVIIIIVVVKVFKRK